MVAVAVTGKGPLHARFTVVRGDADIDVALTVEPGSTLAVLGPNGAGKSTIIDALAGLLPIESGRISIDGDVVDDPAARRFTPAAERRVGVVFQGYALFPHMTALDNVAFGLIEQGVHRVDATRRAARWLEHLDVGGVAASKPSALSGGQAQRVALARAFITNPSLVLLDEPLAALDATSRVTTRRIIGDHLAGFAGPAVIVTHDPTEAFLLADTVCIVEEGRITQTGTPEEIRVHPQSAYAADLAGVNLISGRAASEGVDVGGFMLQVASAPVIGDVSLAIRPQAVSLHLDQPHGSPRNTWATIVERLEHVGDRVRLVVGDPIRLTVEITPASAADLALAQGSRVWLSVKATEISVVPR